jgi:hypothetical protein
MPYGEGRSKRELREIANKYVAEKSARVVAGPNGTYKRIND